MTKGERIKQRRTELSITQEELAKRLHTTKQTISKYEKDIVTNIPSDRLEDIAKALETTPEYLLGWVDNVDLEKEIDPSMAEQDAELLTIFHQLSATDKERLIQMAKLLL